MGCLSGILVVAIEQAVAAPLCTARMVDAGARVIKIERAEGDFARGYDTAAKGESSYFAWLNQGKESLCLNFKDKEDAELLWQIIKRADVVVQNLSPGALARAGFGYSKMKALNKKLILCNVSGYGNTGEVAQQRAYDLLIQAESGLISVSGNEKVLGRIGVSICDIGAGITAYSAILEALIKRGITGEGEELSVSLFDVAAEWMTVPYMHAMFGNGNPKPVGLKHPSIAPYGAFECNDKRLVLISIQNEREWQRLCIDVLQSTVLFENKLFTSNNLRVDNRVELESTITAITKSYSSVQFQERLTKADIAFGLINSASDLANHAAFRNRLARTAGGNTMPLPAHPVVRTSNKDANNTSQQLSTPSLGQHTNTIRTEFTND